MKVNCFKIALFLLCSIGINLPFAWAVQTTNSINAIKIETVDSNSVYLVNIRAEKMEHEIRVTGRAKRKKHTSLRIRGHVDIDLLNKKGEIISHATASLKAMSVNIRHNRFSLFSITLPMPSTDNFIVRVIHTTENLKHIDQRS